jgi:hypothetical protein
VIYPELHYGRDALVGIALFLTQLTKENTTVSALKSKYPNWLMRKDKITLSKTTDTDALLKKIATHFSDEQVTTIDGVKVDFPQGWIHIRKSNTEPIIRIYAEAKTESELDQLVTAIETLVATNYYVAYTVLVAHLFFVILALNKTQILFRSMINLDIIPDIYKGCPIVKANFSYVRGLGRILLNRLCVHR